MQVASGAPGSPTGMRCRIPTPASSGGAAQPSSEADPSAPRQQQPGALSAAAAPAGPISPFASPRALPEPGVPADWDELVGDAADGELEDLVSQMMLSSTLRLFDGGADAATGAPGSGLMVALSSGFSGVREPVKWRGGRRRRCARVMARAGAMAWWGLARVWRKLQTQNMAGALTRFIAMTGDPLRPAEAGSGPDASGQPGWRCPPPETAAVAGHRLTATAAAPAKPLNSPDSHVRAVHSLQNTSQKAESTLQLRVVDSTECSNRSSSDADPL